MYDANRVIQTIIGFKYVIFALLSPGLYTKVFIVHLNLNIDLPYQYYTQLQKFHNLQLKILTRNNVFWCRFQADLC